MQVQRTGTTAALLRGTMGIGLCAALLGLAASCATVRTTAPGPRLPADAAALRAILSSPDTPPLNPFPGRREQMTGSGQHGSYVSVYVNRAAEEAIASRTGSLPAGSLLLIQGFSPTGEPAGAAVMAKIPGRAPASGDWFWALFDREMNVVEEGTAGCAGCHAKVRGNDFVFSGPLR